MTAPGRETLAAALAWADVKAALTPDKVEAAKLRVLADALLAGPLAAPPGDGGGELPKWLRCLALELPAAVYDDVVPLYRQDIADARAAGRADERAAVVAALEDSPSTFTCTRCGKTGTDESEDWQQLQPDGRIVCDDCADAIERGEHRDD